MSYHKMSLTSSKCQFTTFILLSIIWTILFAETTARPNLENLLSKQNDVRVSELFLDELLANTNSDKILHELKKYHQKQPSYLDKWPNLRDLVLMVDYDDTTTTSMESNEISNTKFFERLRQLATSTAEAFDNIRDDSSDNNGLKTVKSSTNQITFKDHNVKKNVQFRKQYMSPCHFKICNMGRKRNARLVTSY